MSPFIDNEAEGYLPERQREINSLAGIESTLTGPNLDADSESEDKPEGEGAEDVAKPNKTKGDIDSSSDEEGASEDLSDSDAEAVEEAPVKGKKGAAAKQAAKKPTAKTAKKI